MAEAPVTKDGGRRPQIPRNIFRNWRSFCEAVLDYIDRQTPVQGSGITIDEMPHGRVINGKPGGSSVSTPLHPFSLVVVRDEDSGAQSIRVLAGTVNARLPTGFNPGDTPAFLIKSPGVSGSVFIKVSVNGEFQVDKITVDKGSKTPNDAAPNYYQTIGSFATSNDGEDNLTVSTTIGGSQQFELCGDVFPLWGLV